MPKQKDLKRLVRTRMQKTGEAYTAARLQLTKKKTAPPPLADLAGMSDASVSKATGRSWEEWVGVLDAAQSADKPHREIAAYVSSLGTSDWWSQMVTVGYERIRGLRQQGQQRGGGFSATKSRTLAVPLARLYKAFSDDDMRGQWLDAAITVRSATKNKRMRLEWSDGTPVQVGFFAKTPAKSMVSIQHEQLPDKAAAEAMKKTWAAQLDRLREVLAG
jgi:hypothetical protein